MTETISRRRKNLANKKSVIPDKSGRFSSLLFVSVALSYAILEKYNFIEYVYIVLSY